MSVKPRKSKHIWSFGEVCSICFLGGFRTRTLLLNTFSISEDSITVDNVFEWVTQLNSTYPEQFTELRGRLEDCNLENELSTVCSSTQTACCIVSQLKCNLVGNIVVCLQWKMMFLLLFGFVA